MFGRTCAYIVDRDAISELELSRTQVEVIALFRKEP
jgi:hypothetical protein